METIKIKNLDFDVHEGPVGIMCSGGADSSLLLYIVATYCKGPIHIFNCGNKLTAYQESQNIVKVVNEVTKLTNRNDFKLHIHWEDRKLMNNSLDIDLVKLLNLNIVYSGLTRPPPPGEVISEDPYAAASGIDDDRPDIKNLNYVSLDYFDKTKNVDINQATSGVDFNLERAIYAPFSNINKKGVADLYKHFNIEQLYQYTRSCESTSFRGRHCGRCWWCKERIWAFGYLE